jgi:nucleoside-diphosphate kinase
MPHPKNERTFIIIKPDGIQRSLVGEIISRFERAGLKLAAAKMVVPDSDRIWKHYNKDEAWFLKKGQGIIDNRTNAGLPVEKEAVEYGKDIVRALEKYMTAGPVVMMVWEGNQSVAVVKKLVGETEPSVSDVGTIRGDYTSDSILLANIDDRAVRNLLHCTDKPEEADHEINLWFKPEEVVTYRHISEAILYDVNLDGIME